MSQAQYPDDFVNRVVCGDCLEVLGRMPDESVDLVVTDPPYGIGFMGKSWDKAIPSVDVWKECLRVLKPGAFAFVMCIPRQDCISRMIISLEDAGFMVNFTPIYHTFATGFPKAGNIGKLVDKRMGFEREVVRVNPQWCAGRKATVIGHTAGNTRPFLEDERAKEFKKYITAPGTPEAKALDGSYAGFQPKPAVEVILTVMKPLSEKTYLDQALANGKGVTWLDSGRVPYKQGQAPSDSRWSGNSPRKSGNPVNTPFKGENGYVDPQQGRFPANLLVSDDVLNDGVERKSGARLRNYLNKDKNADFMSSLFYTTRCIANKGSYSRYFSLDAWADKHLPESARKTFPFLIVPKASKKEKNAGLDGLDDKPNPTLSKYRRPSEGRTASKSGSPQKNHHPTCKPVKLMAYLIAIGSRPDDIVLDPFVGSGTTGVAAKMSSRQYIGIDINPEYCEIAEKRIADTKAEMEEEARQMDMFQMEGAAQT